MNNESRLFVEMKYGIDLSYKTSLGFAAVYELIPMDFRKKYGYSFFGSFGVAHTDIFKAKLVNDLIEYIELRNEQ